MMLSIIALYNYDNTIFNGISDFLPTSPSDPEISVTDFEPIDPETLLNNIMFVCGELELLYSKPDVFKRFFLMWCRKNKKIWQNLYDTMYYRYDPLFSKIRKYTLDRITADSLSETGQDTTNETANSRNINNRDSDTTTNGQNQSNRYEQTNGSSGRLVNENHTDTDVLQVQAFNDIGEYWNNKEKTTNNGSSSTADNLDTATTMTGNDSKTEHEIVNFVDRVTGTLDKTLLNTLDKTLSRQEHGTLKDIITETVQGIRPYQELIKLQRDIAMFNLYDYITTDFKCNFCLLVY